MNASDYIDRKIARQTDWRGRTMAEVRRIIRETVPDVTEELKWMGTPTWSHNGVLCICNPFKAMVKLTFLNGAQLGLDSLFNAELDGTKWRAIKYFERDTVDRAGLQKLLLAAVAFNNGRGMKAKPAAARAKSATAGRKTVKRGKAATDAGSARA